MFKRLLACAVLGLLVGGNNPQKQTAMQAELDKLQGTWNVVALEIGGAKMAENVLKGSKIIVKGDTFVTLSMGAAYKGSIKVDVAAMPKTLDLIFTEGPEKGNTNGAIYELDGDTWKICLNVSGKDRPKEFATKAGSGHALETLKRDAGGKEQEAAKKELALLEGEWSMVSGEIAGQPLPDSYLKGSKRIVKGNETTVTIGGQLFFKATTAIDPSKQPKTIDYTMTDGPTKGKTQYGIYELTGDTVRFCFSAPGKERPTDYTTKAGDDRTSSVWKKAKQ
jgi:uncharacterized protein (TIGR03067 family)